ncbi:hypothetical protein EVAR_59311_1 [Eumeta japonica]|uniref:Uncharacterized protein n=1 Tax=Eumeta variegata TaxID=151549 RepID=A0A4C1YDG0_EUMVA|nr:hypothetical protein EVAR_59311_1 [Eumeta japonica]
MDDIYLLGWPGRHATRIPLMFFILFPVTHSISISVPTFDPAPYFVFKSDNAIGHGFDLYEAEANASTKIKYGLYHSKTFLLQISTRHDVDLGLLACVVTGLVTIETDFRERTFNVITEDCRNVRERTRFTELGLVNAFLLYPSSGNATQTEVARNHLTCRTRPGVLPILSL